MTVVAAVSTIAVIWAVVAISQWRRERAEHRRIIGHDPAFRDIHDGDPS